MFQYIYILMKLIFKKYFTLNKFSLYLYFANLHINLCHLLHIINNFYVQCIIVLSTPLDRNNLTNLILEFDMNNFDFLYIIYIYYRKLYIIIIIIIFCIVIINIHKFTHIPVLNTKSYKKKLLIFN